MATSSDTPSAMPVSMIPAPTGPVFRETAWPGTSPDDLGTSDAQSGQGLVSLLSSIFSATIKALPHRLKTDAKWLVPLALVWIGLWTINTMAMMQLPSMIGTLAHIAIFLTATYNGFFGKLAFVTIVSRTLIPMIREVRAGGIGKIRARYAQTASILRKMVAQQQRNAQQILLVGAGFGLMASNLLTRNNRIDKYFVCVLAAFALYNDLSRGAGNPVIKLTAAGLRDLPKLAGKKISINQRAVYLSLTGFATGLALAFVPGFLNNSYTSLSGVYAGAVVLAAGIALHFMKQKPTAAKP